MDINQNNDSTNFQNANTTNQREDFLVKTCPIDPAELAQCDACQ